MSHTVKGLWVLGGIEHESGNHSPFPDRTTGTLMDVLSEWIYHGTTFINDYLAAYRDLETNVDATP